MIQDHAVLDLLMSSDRPSVWPELPPDVAEKLRQGGLWTPEERVALNLALLGYWFLIRNKPIFDGPKRCTRCNRKHDYVTVGCVELPFNGLREALTWLSTNELGLTEHGLLIDGYVRPGMLVPISAAEAAKRNEIITKARRQQTVLQQAPPRPVEVNATVLEQRLRRTAHSLRPR